MYRLILALALLTACGCAYCRTTAVVTYDRPEPSGGKVSARWELSPR